MNKRLFIFLFVLLFAVAPVLIATSQNVPNQSEYQLAVQLISLAGFGLLLGIVWLTRLLPRDALQVKSFKMMGWHKWIAYAAGTFFMIHPILMIARRFWVLESPPLDNLKLMLGSPLMWPGITAWLLLLGIILFALLRKHFRPKSFRVIHGILSIAFVLLAVWHVIAIGSHSNATLSAFWLVLTTGAITGYARQFVKDLTRKRTTLKKKEIVHEPA